MSIRSSFRPLHDLAALLYPPVCAACGADLAEGARIICTRCRAEIPLTGYWRQPDNPLAQRMWGIVPVQQASAFFFYAPGSVFRDLVHGFKYRGAWLSARQMGEWYGAELASSPLYADVDALVPVPLHPLKRIQRGYNQAEYIARGIARAMDRPLECGCLVRRVHNPSQTRRSRDERWENVEGIFRARHPERLAGRHVLLVDDVFTTGATVCAAAEAILQAAPDCRISVAVLAASRRELGLKD